MREVVIPCWCNLTKFKYVTRYVHVLGTTPLKPRSGDSYDKIPAVFVGSHDPSFVLASVIPIKIELFSCVLPAFRDERKGSLRVSLRTGWEQKPTNQASMPSIIFVFSIHSKSDPSSNTIRQCNATFQKPIHI